MGHVPTERNKGKIIFKILAHNMQTSSDILNRVNHPTT